MSVVHITSRSDIIISRVHITSQLDIIMSVVITGSLTRAKTIASINDMPRIAVMVMNVMTDTDHYIAPSLA
jgi:hypothetical protein